MSILSDMSLILTVIALAVIISTFLLLYTPINKYLRSKLDKTNYETLLNFANTGVRWAEQWLTGATGTFKKKQVVDYVTDKAQEYGLNISAEDIDKAIESAVKELKQQQISKEGEANGI